MDLMSVRKVEVILLNARCRGKSCFCESVEVIQKTREGLEEIRQQILFGGNMTVDRLEGRFVAVDLGE